MKVMTKKSRKILDRLLELSNNDPTLVIKSLQYSDRVEDIVRFIKTNTKNEKLVAS